MINLKSKTLFYVWIVGIALLLNACSSIQLAYNQSDLLLKWWIDEYIDTSSDQEHLFDHAYPNIIAKHRQEQLPKAAEKIRQLRLKLNQALPAPDALNVVKDIKSFSLDSMNMFVEDAAKLSLSIQPKQLTYMENAFAKSNKKFQNEYLSGSAEDRLHARVEKIIERTESFSGGLSKSQKLRIQEIAKDNLIDSEIIYQIRLSKQQLILKNVKKIAQEQPTINQSKLILSQLLNDLVWGSTSELIELERKRDQQSAIIISKITELFDAQQLKKSQAKLKNWEMDIQKLIDKK